MHGDLRTTSLEQLCRTLDARQATGELTIDGESNQIRVWFRQGRVVRATASKHELRLGDRLIHGGLMTSADLSAALAAQAGTGKHLGEVLVEEGLVNHHVVRAFMQEQVLDALFAAVRWTNGTYTFAEDEIPTAAVPTDLTVAQLLFALETRHRVWDEITRTMPDLDRVPEVVPGADPSDAQRDQGEAAIVHAIDGVRSVNEIAEELGFGPYEVAAVVHGLTVLGQVRLQQAEAPQAEAPLAEAPQAEAPQAPQAEAPQAPTGADPASAAATAISEAAAFLRGDGPAPTTPDPVDAPAPAAPASTDLDAGDLDDLAALLATDAPPTSEPLPAPPTDVENRPSSIDFAASLADVMADLDMDAPRGGRREPEPEAELAVLAPDPLTESPAAAPVVLEDPAADLPLPAPPGSATTATDDTEAEAAAAPPAPPAPPAAPAEVEEETTFLIMDEDLSQEAPTPPPLVPPMDSRPAPPPGGEGGGDDDPQPWAFVIGGDDGEEATEDEPRRRRSPSSPITATVTADPSTGTPLPTPSAAPEPDAAPEPAPEPEPEAPPAPSRPRQTGEMSDLLRELRQLSDE